MTGAGTDVIHLADETCSCPRWSRVFAEKGDSAPNPLTILMSNVLQRADRCRTHCSRLTTTAARCPRRSMKTAPLFERVMTSDRCLRASATLRVAMSKLHILTRQMYNSAIEAGAIAERRPPHRRWEEQ